VAFVTKDEIVYVGVIGAFCLAVIGGMALLPDREITDNQYVELAKRVELCPDAQSALDAINKDHKILQSEGSELENIIKGYVEQDERITKAQNIQVAKGLLKGPLRRRTCLPLDAPDTVPTTPKLVKKS
jgi:hypothetical protein